MKIIKKILKWTISRQLKILEKIQDDKVQKIYNLKEEIERAKDTIKRCEDEMKLEDTRMFNIARRMTTFQGIFSDE